MSESEEVVTEPLESKHVPEAIPEVIPTVVVGKKKKVEVPQALPPAEQPEEPTVEVEKPKPKRASRARLSTKAPPPTPEPVP